MSTITKNPASRISSLLSLSALISTNAALGHNNAPSAVFSPVRPTALTLHHNSVLQSSTTSTLLNHGLSTSSNASHQTSVSGNHASLLQASSANHLVNVFALPHNNVATLQASTIDLSSSAANITLGASLFNSANSVAITVGGVTQTFHTGSQVTAAEYVAIRQILGGSSQTLVVNSAGVASGGSFSLNAVASPKVSELVVPVGVVALDNVSSNKSLNFGGDLLNYGSIYGVATGSGSYSGVISAKDIINEVGGVISSQMPVTLTSAGKGVSSTIDLTLLAANNITNAGTITSSGNLSLVVGGSITNSGLVSTSSGNLNLLSTNNIGAFNILGSGGTFSAANNNINIGTTEPNKATALAIVMSGGDYLSNNLNINTGSGSVTGSVGQLSGVLNTTASDAHLFADTKTLYLGQNNISGDPTYVNAGGDVVIDGAVTAAEDLTIISAGNITASGNAYLSTANASSAQGAPSTDITLIAGAKVSLTGSGTGGVNSATATNISTIGALNGSQVASLFLAPGGNGSGTGGNIDLSGSTHSGPVIDTSSSLSNTAGNQVNGGNVTLAALGISAGTGQIILPTSGTVITTSSANGTGGNVLIIAGAAPTAAAVTVKSGDINTTGATTSGNVGVYTSEPTSTVTNQTIAYNTIGAVSTGNALTYTSTNGTPTLQANAQVQLGNIITSGGNGSSGAGAGNNATAGNGGNGGNAGTITIAAGSNITTSNLNASGGGGGGGGAAGIGGTGGNGGNGGNGAAINITSTAGAVQVNGDVIAAGGGGGGGGSDATATTAATGGTGGSAAGSTTISGISVNAGGSFNITGGLYDIAGGAGGSGGSSTNTGAGGGGGASFGNGGGGGAGASTAGGGAGGGGLTGGGGGGSSSAIGTGGSGGMGGGGNGSGSGGVAGQNGNAGSAGGADMGGTGAPGGGSQTAGAVGGTQGNPGAGGANTGTAGTSGAVLTATASNTGNVNVTAANVTVGADVDGYNISLTGTSTGTTQGGGGFVALGCNINAGQNVVLAAAGSGTITQASGKEIFAVAELHASSVSGDIASTSQNLLTNAASVNLSSTSGSLYVHDTNATIIIGSGTANNYVLNDDSAISYGNDSTTGTSVTITATNAINLSVTGSGGITQTTAGNLLTAPTVTLTTNQGSIGTNVQYIGIKAPTLIADTNENKGGGAVGTGQVWVNDTAAALNVTGTGSSYVLTDNVAGGVVVTVPTALVSSGMLSISNNLGNLSFAGAGKLYGGSEVSLASGGVLDLGGLYASGKSAPEGPGSVFNAVAGSNIVMSGNLGAVTIDTSSTSANGGNVTLVSGYQFALGSNGQANAGASTAGGGSILFNSGTTVAFNLDSTASQGTAGNFTAQSSAGATKYSGVFLDNSTITATASSGNGAVEIGAGGVNASGQTIVVGNISAAAAKTDTSGFVSLLGTTGGKTGSITAGTIIAGDAISIVTGGNIVYGAGTYTSSLTLQSIGANVALPESSFTADANSNGNGGTINITGVTVTWAGNTTTPLTLNASASGNANGGSIAVNVTGTKGVVVGGSKGDYILTATGGSTNSTSGNGGLIAVLSGGNLTVDATKLNAGPLGTGAAVGATYILRAGNAASGNLFVSGSLDASAKGNDSGGNITLVANSATPFTIDSAKAKTDGVLGSLTAASPGGSAGVIDIANHGGGVTVNTPFASGAYNELVVNASKAGAITLTTSLGDSTTTVISLTTVTGAIVDKASTITAESVSLTSTSGAITATVNTSGMGINTAGAVVAHDLNSQLTLGPSSGKTFVLTSAGDLTTNALTSASGVTLTANNGSILLDQSISGGSAAKNSLTVTGTGTINVFSSTFQVTGGTLTLSAAAGAIGNMTPLNTNAGTLSATSTSGIIEINDTNAAKVSVKALDSSGTIALTALGAIADTAKTLNASELSLRTQGSVGGISIGGVIGGASTSAVYLIVNGSGNITGTQLITAGNVVMTDAGGAIGSIKVNAADVSGVAMKGKAVTIADVSTSPVTLNTSGSGGTFTFTAANGVTVNSVSAAVGLLKIVSTKGTLTVAKSAQVTTANGGITLEAADPKAGAIVISDNVTIASLAAKAGSGVVTIAVGSATPAKVVGTEPVNVSPSTVGTGKIYYGKNGIVATGASNQLKAINTNLIFSTGALPASAITIGTANGAVTITADPPATSNTLLSNPAALLTNPTALTAPIAPVMSTVSPSVLSPATVSTVNSVVSTTMALSASVPNATTTGLIASELATIGAVENSPATITGGVTQNISIVDTDSHFGSYNGVVDATVSSDKNLGLASANGRSCADFDSAVKDGINQISLHTGNLLLAPTVATRVETAFGTVDIRAGSVVLIMALPRGLAAYDMHDNERGAVRVTVCGKSLDLAPGRHVLVAPTSISAFEEVNPAELIGYGEVASSPIGGEMQIFTADFSIPSAISSVRPLAQLAVSKHAGARAVSGNILKTAAIIMQLKSGINYERKVRVVMTAMR